MKKLIFGLLLMFAISNGASAQTKDSASTKYWYYPTLNVYYNQTSGNYWYYDEPTTQWTAAKTLPTTYVVTKTSPHYDVTYKGSDVWKENAAHKEQYNKVNKTNTEQKPPAP